MSTKVLFACSKCFSRHPFEELSAGQQLCKDCRGTHPSLKCNYCRSEFQPGGGKSNSICKKCEQNVKQHGKPSACECCNIIAAFIGSKCQRCANNESKYGPPVQCEQCKQRCAFDKHDENKKIDGKLLCWLCTLSYKRAVLKARQVKEDTRQIKKRPHDKSAKDSAQSSKKSSQRSDLSKQQSSSSDVPEKMSRQSVSNNNGGLAALGIMTAAPVTIDPNSSDHVVAMTELREQIASMQKKLNMKDKDLLEKDKVITELKGRNFDNVNEMRNKLKETERIYDMKIDLLNKKVAGLLKEVATLKKASKKNGTTAASRDRDRESNTTSSSSTIDQKESSKDSGGSATNSPITN